MIQFACRCGNKFSLPEDQAGTMLQCPSCGMLVDVPSLDDLANLQADGTYGVAESKPTAKQTEKGRDFANFANRDDQTDRRTSVEEFLELDDAEPIGLAEPTRMRPHYDPLTGELVRPLGVAEPIAPPVARPMSPATQTLGYARTSDSVAPPGVFSVYWRAFLPHSLPVWFSLAFMLLVATFFGSLWPIGILFTMLFGPFIWLIVTASFGNIVEDTGPEERDELPTPLRYVSFTEDIWRPFVRVVLGIVVVFVPLQILVNAIGLTDFWLRLGVAAAGFLAYPVLLLTSTTSAFVANFSPMRLVGTAFVCGWRYVLAAVTLFVGMQLMLAPVWLSIGEVFGFRDAVAGFIALPLAQPIADFITAQSAAIQQGLLIVGITAGVYLTAVGCWQVGLLYRYHFSRFPWVMADQLIRSTRNDTTSRLKRLRDAKAAATASADPGHGIAPGVRTAARKPPGTHALSPQQSAR